jgi:hypothetical protein
MAEIALPTKCISLSAQPIRQRPTLALLLSQLRAPSCELIEVGFCPGR